MFEAESFEAVVSGSGRVSLRQSACLRSRRNQMQKVVRYLHAISSPLLSGRVPFFVRLSEVGLNPRTIFEECIIYFLPSSVELMVVTL